MIINQKDHIVNFKEAVIVGLINRKPFFSCFLSLALFVLSLTLCDGDDFNRMFFAGDGFILKGIDSSLFLTNNTTLMTMLILVVAVAFFMGAAFVVIDNFYRKSDIKNAHENFSVTVKLHKYLFFFLK